MKTLRTVSLQIVLGISFGELVLAAEINGEPQTDATASYQDTAEHIESLEAELSAAQQEVTRLQAELTAAKQQLASLDRTRAIRDSSNAPVALTRLSEDRLQDGGVRNIARIDRQVPGMIYGRTGNEARFALRGAYTNRTGPEAAYGLESA